MSYVCCTEAHWKISVVDKVVDTYKLDLQSGDVRYGGAEIGISQAQIYVLWELVVMSFFLWPHGFNYNMSDIAWGHFEALIWHGFMLTYSPVYYTVAWSHHLFYHQFWTFLYYWKTAVGEWAILHTQSVPIYSCRPFTTSILSTGYFYYTAAKVSTHPSPPSKPLFLPLRELLFLIRQGTQKLDIHRLILCSW